MHFCVIPSDNEVLVIAIVTVAKPPYDVFPGVKRKLYCILFLLFSRDLGIQVRLRNKGCCGRYDLEPVRRSDYGSSWTQRSGKDDHNVHSNRYIALRRFVSSSNCLLLSPVSSLTHVLTRALQEAKNMDTIEYSNTIKIKNVHSCCKVTIRMNCLLVLSLMKHDILLAFSYTYKHAYICVYICMYTYKYIYTHIYTYVHMYIHI